MGKKFFMRLGGNEDIVSLIECPYIKKILEKKNIQPIIFDSCKVKNQVSARALIYYHL